MISRDTRFALSLISALTLLVLLVHGYHPYSEDGGVYLAGIERLLNPNLFPAYTAFVTEHLRFSLFAPCVAALVRITHLPLPWTLLGLYLASTWLTLYAGWLLIARATTSRAARAGAVTLLACLFAIPVAGTSLYLMDPYVTARSLTTPLGLFALFFALRPRKPILCALTLLAAAAIHPLMAGYALAAVLVLLAVRRVPHSSRPFRDEWVRLKPFLVLLTMALLVAAAIQHFAPPESPAYLTIALSRYYWFPFWWQWYEQLGLIAPLLVLYALSRSASATAQLLSRSSLALAGIALAVALAFARVHLQTHLVARLQPLRAFQLVYALMILLLGAFLGEHLLRRQPSRWIALLLLCATPMFLAARRTYPASAHLELPWLPPINPWEQAFLWVRNHTPRNAVFALDAAYITQGKHEDAQCFRAIAERNALPDYSKDGGEAAITPALTAAWIEGQTAQTGLEQQTDAAREAALKPLGATWAILETNSATAWSCPYRNATVKVCQLP